MTLLDDIDQRMNFSKRQLATLDVLARRLAGCDKISEIYEKIEADLGHEKPEGLGFQQVKVLEKLRSGWLYTLPLEGDNNFRHYNSKETLVQLDDDIFLQMQRQEKVTWEGKTYFPFRATRLLDSALLGVMEIGQELSPAEGKLLKDYAIAISVELSPRYFRKEKEQARKAEEAAIARRKEELAEEKERLAKKRERMIRTMREGIHDVRRRMVAPTGYASLARRMLQEGRADKALEFIGRVESSLQKGAAEMLYLQRVFDEEKPKREITNLYHIVEEIVREQKDSLLTNEQKYLENGLDPTAYTLRVDPIAMEMALGELIHNAIKYSPPGSEIIIDGERKEKNASLRVRNTGVHFTPEQIEAMYEPENAHGTGIGMNFIRRVVEEEHQGKLEISSGDDYLQVTMHLPL